VSRSLRSCHAWVVVAVVLCGAATPRAAEAQEGPDAEAVAGLLELVIDADADTARKCLHTLSEMVQTGQVSAEQSQALKPRLAGHLKKILAGDPQGPLYTEAALLAASWAQEAGLKAARAMFADAGSPAALRLAAMEALVSAKDPGVGPAAEQWLADPKASSAFKASILGVMGRLGAPSIGQSVLRAYPDLEPELRPKAIELLTQRATWGAMLVSAVESKQVSPGDLNGNQIRKLRSTADETLKQKITAIWGAVREGRNPDRERLIARVRRDIQKKPGDPTAGAKVFQRVCAQCHVIHGQGNAIGPDLTGNGRGSFEQLLSNVLDPNLVIGNGYQLRTVLMNDGRALAGMLAEENEQRLVLKMLGGKIETVARRDVKQIIVSPVSFMPEGLEQAMSRQELIDLFAYLAKNVPEPDSGYVPGYPAQGGR